MASSAHFFHTLCHIESVEVLPWRRCAAPRVDTLIARLPELVFSAAFVCGPLSTQPPCSIAVRSPYFQALLADDCWTFAVSSHKSRAGTLVPSARNTFPAHQVATRRAAATCMSISSNSPWSDHESPELTRLCLPVESFHVRKRAPNAPAVGVEHGHLKVLTQMKPSSLLALRAARHTMGARSSLKPCGRHTPNTSQEWVTDCRHLPTRTPRVGPHARWPHHGRLTFCNQPSPTLPPTNAE